MKFLLTAINSKYIHSNPAIYSLRAYAGEELQEHIELAEYTINQPFTDILADIYKRKPDVIGFSCYIWNINMILELVTELHKIVPDVPIWLGGPEVSFDAPKLLTVYPQIRGVMIGEGEETFKELLQYYVETPREIWMNMTSDLRRIPGLCLCDGFTAPRELLDMSTLPFLYSSLKEFENKIIYYESSSMMSSGISTSRTCSGSGPGSTSAVTSTVRSASGHHFTASSRSFTPSAAYSPDFSR